MIILSYLETFQVIIAQFLPSYKGIKINFLRAGRAEERRERERERKRIIKHTLPSLALPCPGSWQLGQGLNFLRAGRAEERRERERERKRIIKHTLPSLALPCPGSWQLGQGLRNFSVSRINIFLKYVFLKY